MDAGRNLFLSNKLFEPYGSSAPVRRVFLTSEDFGPEILRLVPFRIVFYALKIAVLLEHRTSCGQRRRSGVDATALLAAKTLSRVRVPLWRRQAENERTQILFLPRPKKVTLCITGTAL